MRRFNKKDIESTGFETVFRGCDDDTSTSTKYSDCLWKQLDTAEITVDIPEVVELEPEPVVNVTVPEPPKERPTAGAQTILTSFILILLSMLI